MTKVILYSDCGFFAGCENMMTVLMNSDDFRNKYSPTFYYRKSRSYEHGLNKRIDYPTLAKPSGVRIIERGQIPKVIRDNLTARACWRFFAILASPVCQLLNLVTLFRLLSNSTRETIIINNGGYPGAHSCLQAAVISKLLGFERVIMIINNSPRPRRWKLFRFLDYFNRCILASLDVIVTGSDETGLAIKEFGCLDSAKFMTIPNGIEEKHYSDADILLRRSKIFIPKQILKISIVGLHEERKGHFILLESIYKLSARRADLAKYLKVSIEGDGNLTPSLKRYVKETNISHIVRFVGHATNMSAFYADTDILVLPSLHSEDLPNVISEAMLFGVPTIGSKIAGIPSQIEEEFNGFLIESGDSDQLALKIEEFLENTSLLTRMSANCVDRFYEKFHSDVAISQYINLIDGDL
jgi:glycosyltransferase involved in cell wall biosynthesis